MPNIVLFFCFCLNPSSCQTLSCSFLKTGPSLETQMELYLHHKPFSQMEASATWFSSTLLIDRAPSLSTLFTMNASCIIYHLDHILVICCISDISLNCKILDDRDSRSLFIFIFPDPSTMFNTQKVINKYFWMNVGVLCIDLYFRQSSISAKHNGSKTELILYFQQNWACGTVICLSLTLWLCGSQ